MSTTELVLDHQGILAVNDGIVFYLTECCKASGKGSSNSPTGVCCRACYQPVPEVLAGAWLVSDGGAWKTWAEEFTAWAVEANAANATSDVLPRLISSVRQKAGATTGYICKRCGAESPVGIGYAGQPDVDEPAPDCPNPHEHNNQKEAS